MYLSYAALVQFILDLKEVGRYHCYNWVGIRSSNDDVISRLHIDNEEIHL